MAFQLVYLLAPLESDILALIEFYTCGFTHFSGMVKATLKRKQKVMINDYSDNGGLKMIDFVFFQ